jgi:hypothetical protein
MRAAAAAIMDVILYMSSKGFHKSYRRLVLLDSSDSTR